MPIAELAVIMAASALLLWPARARLRNVITTLPVRYVMACLTSIGLLLIGHAITRNEDTYPLVAWDMYTVNDPRDPQFVDYVGVLASGREERLLLARLFPAGGRHFRARVDHASLAVADDSLPGHQQAIDQLDRLLAAVATAYDAQHPSDSVRVIRLWLGTVPAQAYAGPQSIRRRLIHEYTAP